MSTANTPNQYIAPVRRRAAPPLPEPYEDAEIDRGQRDAVLGALGRMQLRLDLLAREQTDALDKVLAMLDVLSAKLDEIEVIEVEEEVEQAGPGESD